MSRDLDAGWLCREIKTHDKDREIRDAHAWSWDITRPIAEQELEIKSQYNSLGALFDAVKEAGGTMRLHGEPVTESELRAHAEQLADDKIARIAEQTRHDVAASVVRHVSLEKIELVVIDECSFVDRRVGEDLESFGTSSHAVVDRPEVVPDGVACLTDNLEYATQQVTQARHGHAGPAVVLELEIGDEPEQGVEIELRDEPTPREMGELQPQALAEECSDSIPGLSTSRDA